MDCKKEFIMANGLLHCVNCVGLHPDEPFTKRELYNKIMHREKDLASKLMRYKKIKTILYANKSCAMCGRSYDQNGDFDESWKITAKRVKQELDNAGLFGVPDEKVNEVVASCRKAFIFLMNNKKGMTPEQMERFTFNGRLALIITHAQEARKSKLGNANFKTGI